MEVQWRTWDMRDNWMSHPDFSEGDDIFEISHSMLIDRLQYLPGNQIEGNQTVMVRAILGDEASTNLVSHVFVLGSEPENERYPGSQNDNLLVSALSLVVALLILLLTLAVMRLRQERVDDESEDSTHVSIRFDGD